MAYVPTYTADELRNFASTYLAEQFKQNVFQIVNRVSADVLRHARNGKNSSITDITTGRYTCDEINTSLRELARIFPPPTTIVVPDLEYLRKIIVTWDESSKVSGCRF
jgi:hypothetical protein